MANKMQEKLLQYLEICNNLKIIQKTKVINYNKNIIVN